MMLCGERRCHNCYTNPILRPTRMLVASRISMLLYLAKLRHELLFTAEPGLTVEQEWRVERVHQHSVLGSCHVSIFRSGVSIHVTILGISRLALPSLEGKLWNFETSPDDAGIETHARFGTIRALRQRTALSLNDSIPSGANDRTTSSVMPSDPALGKQSFAVGPFTGLALYETYCPCMRIHAFRDRSWNANKTS